MGGGGKAPFKYDNVPAEVPVTKPVPVADLDQYLSIASWIAAGIKHLGFTEFSHDKFLSKDWKYTTDCKGLTSTIGTSNAWCAAWVGGRLEETGHTSAKTGRAAGYRNWADPCGYIFGAILPLRHVGNNSHVTFFLWWIDEKNKIAACLGGNQSNGVRITAINISGNAKGHDEVVPSPRWPKGAPRTSGPYKPPGWAVGSNQIGGTTR